MNREIISLGDQCEFINGGAWKQNEYDNTGHPVVQVSNIKNDVFELSEQKFLRSESFERYKKHKIECGDLIIATVGSHPSQPSAAGRAAVANEQIDGMLLNQNAVLIRSTSPKLRQDYLCLIGRSPDFRSYVQNAGKGAANQVRIAIGAIRAFEFELPNVEHQTKTAEIINSYDDLIENNRRRIALLEQAARLLYREWFVHFRFPGHETANFVDGLPEGWSRKTIGQHCPFVYGKALKADTRIEGDVDVYGSSGIVGSHNKTLVKGNAIVVGRKGNVGSVYWAQRDFWPIDTVYYVAPVNSDYFTYHALKNVTFINTDVAVPGLNRDYAHSRELRVPDDALLSEFNEKASSFMQQIEVLSIGNTQLTKARDLLLPRLMDGRIPV